MSVSKSAASVLPAARRGPEVRDCERAAWSEGAREGGQQQKGQKSVSPAEGSRGLEEIPVIYICRYWSPQIPALIKENQLKFSSFHVYLN